MRFIAGCAVGVEFFARVVVSSELRIVVRAAHDRLERPGMAGRALQPSSERVFTPTLSLPAPLLLLLLSLSALSHADRRLGFAVLSPRSQSLPHRGHLSPARRRSPAPRRSSSPFPPRPRLLELPGRRSAVDSALGARQGRAQRRGGAAEVPRGGRKPGRCDLASKHRNDALAGPGARGRHAAATRRRAARCAASTDAGDARDAAGGARPRGERAADAAERGAERDGAGGAAGREAASAAERDGERRDGGSARDARGGRRGGQRGLVAELRG